MPTNTSAKLQILFVYLGDEQGSWGTICYSRPWHYYIMPGILYCAQALRNDPEIAGRCDISCRHFNRTAQDTDRIGNEILDGGYHLLGFSCYCWNIDDNLRIARALKEKSPGVRIMFGGPEVFKKNQGEVDAFFGDNPFVDALAFGESERKIAALVKALLFGETSPTAGTKGYAFAAASKLGADFEVEYVDCAADVPGVYPFAFDIPRTKDCGLAMVYETGRGCPYRCIYCQFGHRNHKPFRFDLKRVQSELTWLFEQRIDCIHFADAVFDLDAAYAKSVLRIVLEQNIATSTFFYCSFFGLDDELADLFSKTQCQIGVGIQSTNPSVLHEIKRALSPRLFDDILDTLARHPINFYTDLIFGLPGDSLDSFRRSLDQTLGLKPAFVMPFPLTLIKGTPLGDTPERYGVQRFETSKVRQLDLMCDIQYDNIGLYREFSLDDLERFDDVALALFYFYNRFPYSLSYLQARAAMGPFELYQAIGGRTKAFLRHVGRKASNTEFIDGFQDEIFAIFAEISKREGAGERERNAFNDLFKLDIFRILVLNSPLREKIFRNSLTLRPTRAESVADDSEKQRRVVKKTHGKTITTAFRLSDLVRLAELRASIEPCTDSVFVHAPFENYGSSERTVTQLEQFLIEIIPADRGVRTKSVMQSAQRQFAGRGRAPQADEKQVKEALELLAKEDIILIYE